MTETRVPLLRDATEGDCVAVVGDLYRILATGADTDGKYAQFDAVVPPGGGPPPHIHSREEEAFFILEGEITFHVGERRFTAGPGMFANIPIGVLHAFRNESDRPARMLITVAPAGLEKMFLEVGKPMPAGTSVAPPPSPEEIGKLLKRAPDYGIEIRIPAPH